MQIAHSHWHLTIKLQIFSENRSIVYANYTVVDTKIHSYDLA